MEVLIIGVIFLFGIFFLKPAVYLARATRARKLKVEINLVSSDDVFGLTLFYAVIVYLFGWWFLEITGLLALISNEF